MEPLIFFGVPAVIFVFYVIMSAKADEKVLNSLAAEFPEAKIFVSPYNRSYLAVDFRKEKIAIGQAKGGAHGAPYRLVVPFGDIVKSELMKDGVQVVSTSRGSQAIGAAVGAVALGGVGAIIGGLSGSSKSSESSKYLALRVTVSNGDSRVHEVCFYKNEKEGEGVRGNSCFDSAEREVSNFSAYLDSIIRKTEMKPKAAKVSSADRHSSIHHEVDQLWRLQEQGALTIEEFEAEKAKLLQV